MASKARAAAYCKVGIALYPRHGDNIEAILNAADSAMYAAKRAGRHTHRFAPPITAPTTA